MEQFDSAHLRNIRSSFEEKTGVRLTRPPRRRLRTLLPVAAAAVLCLALSAFAVRRFSALDGDEVALGAVYEGGGIVRVAVENRSDRVLRFQETLKLMRWATGEELAAHGAVGFEGTTVPAHGSGTLTLDLSAAYDLAALERPVGEWYYFVLTNNCFAFGQDWTCSVDFTPPLPREADAPRAAQANTADLADVETDLRPYFEAHEPDPAAQREKNAAYAAQVEALLGDFPGALVSPAAPALLPEEIAADAVFDPSFTADAQRTLTGLHTQSLDWDGKLLAREGEQLLVLSVMLPLKGYEDVFRGLPVRYYAIYEKAAVTPEARTFLYGRLLGFDELARFLVWEDESRAVYEVHELICGALRPHTEAWLALNPDVRFDETLRQRIQNVCDYFDAHTEFVDR